MPSFTSILTLSLTAVVTLAVPAPTFTRRHTSYSNSTSATSTSSSAASSSSSSWDHGSSWNDGSSWDKDNKHHSCLTSTQAQQIATSYGLLISNYSDALADAVLMSNFTDYSQSVNTLINQCPQGSEAHQLPLDAPTFTSLAKFKAGQSQQPPINFAQLAIFPACDSVTIRWRTTNTVNATDLLPTATEGVRPVVGLITMEVARAPENAEIGWKIHTVYSEFDSGAWLQNLRDADICGNPEKNLGAPDAAMAVGADGAPAAAGQMVKRARMYI